MQDAAKNISANVSAGYPTGVHACIVSLAALVSLHLAIYLLYIFIYTYNTWDPYMAQRISQYLTLY